MAYLLDLNKNSILLTSTDRGASWSVRPIGANPSGMWLYDLAFTSDQVGYVAGFSDGCGSCPVILKTTDGGDSWNPTTFAGNGAINSIDFLDAQKGFAVGGPGLLKTTDAGASSKPIESAAIDAVAPSQVTFATATVGYVSAIPQGGQGWPTVLLKTTDGGATWATIQDNGTNVNALAFRELHFFGPDTGVAVGREEFASFLLGSPKVRSAFLKYHRALLSVNFWKHSQDKIRAGHFEDFFPYPEELRFCKEFAGAV